MSLVAAKKYLKERKSPRVNSSMANTSVIFRSVNTVGYRMSTFYLITLTHISIITINFAI